jgi:Alw26I/Eco31I/Esp3I family type II restriction endonuclease
MRKEILITNYNPLKLKEARELTGITYEYFETDDSVDIEKLEMFENNEPITPIDIFLLGYLFNVYENQAKENGVKKFLSLTTDILFPHPSGIKYQEFIVSHPNYKGMPVTRNGSGNVSWMTTIQTDLGKERMVFWGAKMKELNINANSIMDAGIRKKVAYENHPTKKHICLFSGTELSLEYRYPAPQRIDLINKGYDESFKYYDLDIYELATVLFEIDECKIFKKVFNIKNAVSIIDDCKIIKNTFKINNPLSTRDGILKHLKDVYVLKEKRGYVSPGVMSNSPDRLDGFHSYNNDVRDVCDTGRRKDNLKKYTQDRRVYEMWSDGDWKKADRLYATFVKNGVSPDHIGPMSLGFAHRPKFQPMTASQNSSKGNRMTLADVNILIDDEKKGDNVVTWHSKYIWDNLKGEIQDDADALKLSALMRKNLHHVLIVFSIINENGFNKFLEQFLNPEYSYYDYEFEDFNADTGEYGNVITKKLEGKNQENNVNRYFRIAFEKLVEYADKDNRKNKIWDSKSIDSKIIDLISLLKKDKNDVAVKLLHQIFKDLSDITASNW